MSQIAFFAVGAGTLLSALVVVQEPARAQYDLNTCSGNYNYCLEWARRRGQPIGSCEAAYQECMRRGSWTKREPYNPQVGPAFPVERR
jgi:hypothetical protein